MRWGIKCIVQDREMLRVSHSENPVIKTTRGYEQWVFCGLTPKLYNDINEAYRNANGLGYPNAQYFVEEYKR